MKTCLFLAIAAFALAGCHSKSPANGEGEGGSVNLFKQGKGVLLSEETQKLFEIVVAEVTEKPVQRRVERSAQVYRAGVGGETSSALILLEGDEMSGVKEGQVMQIRCTQGEKVELPARLARIDKATVAALGRAEGLVEFTDPGQKFQVGDFVTASFVSGEAKPVWTIPSSALLVTAEGSFVYVVNGEHLTRTKIKTGASSDGAVEIQDGLYAGDSVAI